MAMVQPIEEVSIQDALTACARFTGKCSRATLYRWMEALRIKPADGFISKRELAMLCVWGKAIAKTRSRRAASRAMSKAVSGWTETQLYEFAFSEQTTFISITEEVNYVSA